MFFFKMLHYSCISSAESKQLGFKMQHSKQTKE